MLQTLRVLQKRDARSGDIAFGPQRGSSQSDEQESSNMHSGLPGVNPGLRVRMTGLLVRKTPGYRCDQRSQKARLFVAEPGHNKNGYAVKKRETHIVSSEKVEEADHEQGRGD